MDKIKVIQDLARSAEQCILTTPLTRMPVDISPRALKNIDSDGVLWFWSRPDSRQGPAQRKNSEIKLFYSNQSRGEYLSIYGDADIVMNSEKENDFWSSSNFSGSTMAHSFCINTVKPTRIYYWDKLKNEMVSLLQEELEPEPPLF